MSQPAAPYACSSRDLVEAEAESPRPSPGVLTVLFVTTVFLSSALLFVIEPMFTKLLLPLLGGSPSVWNTCMVFFQAMLMLGYMYAHQLGRSPLLRAGVIAHCAVVFLPLAVLPIAIHNPFFAAATSHPIVSILSIASVSIALPFFVLSSTNSVLQLWLSRTSHPRASDPYFLYAASNAGSFIGLAAYPLAIEPLFALSQQSRFWTIGYCAFAALLCACALLSAQHSAPVRDIAAYVGKPITLSTKLKWASFAFVPSALMYGVTADLATNFPPMPLIWVIPVAIYLATFIRAFSGKPHPLTLVNAYLPTILSGTLAFVLPSGSGSNSVYFGIFLLFAFGVIAQSFHCELAAQRPNASALTSFYLWLCFGGVLGGIFAGLIAPTIFSGIFEIPITLVAAAALVPYYRNPPQRSHSGRYEVAILAVICLLAVALRASHSDARWLFPLLIIGAVLPLGLPHRLLAPLLLLLSLCIGYPVIGHITLARSRSFFGVYEVGEYQSPHMRFLAHGPTIHGAQYVSGPDRLKPLTYFGTPVRIAFSALRDQPNAKIAVVGLGVGSIACYTSSSQSMTFFEIDPLVEELASRSGMFTYMRDCPGHHSVILGDARLTLRSQRDASYDVIVLDAFNGDSIPAHLLTREAFQIYSRKLTPNGFLLIHISNRFLDLAPIIRGEARDLNLTPLLYFDYAATPPMLASEWTILTGEQHVPDFLNQGWTRMTAGRTVSWTDDRSNIVSLLKVAN